MVDPAARAQDPLPGESTSDYRLRRLEGDISVIRDKVESSQGAMLSAVGNLQTQLTKFQLDLSEELANKYVRLPEHIDLARRVEDHDRLYIQGLQEANRQLAASHTVDNDRNLKVNLAIGTAVFSVVVTAILHFIKVA